MNQLEAALDKVDRTADEGVRDMLTYAHARTTMPGNPLACVVPQTDSLRLGCLPFSSSAPNSEQPIACPVPHLYTQGGKRSAVAPAFLFILLRCRLPLLDSMRHEITPRNKPAPLAGSCTACVGLMRESSMMVANLGDSGFRVISAGQCMFGSEVGRNPASRFTCRCAP